jgi:predicted MFS family arabinose efflux permease
LLFRPAAHAHTPAVVGTGPLLSSANALNALTGGTVRLVGAPLGGVLFALAGVRSVIPVDVATCLVSALAIFATARRPSRAVGDRVDLAAGLRFVRSDRIARALLVITTTFFTANACLSALLVPFGVEHLGGSTQTGFLLSALGAGFLLGAPLGRLLVDHVGLRHLLVVSHIATAGAFLLLFNAPSLAAAVLVGVFGSMTLTTPQTALQRITPNGVLGRVSAVFFTAEAVATLGGAVIGPVVAQATSLRVTLNAASAVTLAVGVLGLALLPSGTVSGSWEHPRRADDESGGRSADRTGRPGVR